MEQVPKFKIIGNISPEEKVKQEQELYGLLHEKHLSNLTDEDRLEIEQQELQKSETERSLIDFANQKTNELMEMVGVNSYNVPQRNFHIVPKRVYQKICGSESNSAMLYEQQAIFFDASVHEHSNIRFGTTSFHELLHLKGFFAMEINKDEKGNLIKTPYREGIGVRALQKNGLANNYYECNRGLHEAIISSYEMEYVRKMFELPLFKDEKDWLASEHAQSIKQQVAKKNGINVNEIEWVSNDGKIYKVAPYPYFRKVFQYVIDTISKKEISYNPETLRNEFLKSHFTGHLQVVARLMENTFGTGSFRLLSMMDNKENTFKVYKMLSHMNENKTIRK